MQNCLETLFFSFKIYNMYELCRKMLNDNLTCNSDLIYTDQEVKLILCNAYIFCSLLSAYFFLQTLKGAQNK